MSYSLVLCCFFLNHTFHNLQIFRCFNYFLYEKLNVKLIKTPTSWQCWHWLTQSRISSYNFTLLEIIRHQTETEPSVDKRLTSWLKRREWDGDIFGTWGDIVLTVSNLLEDPEHVGETAWYSLITASAKTSGERSQLFIYITYNYI